MVHLVLDEQLSGRLLTDSLRARGYPLSTVGDIGAQGRPDPDVMKRAATGQKGNWVLITMDTTILEDHPRFAWRNYAIAWVSVNEQLLGAAFEQSKVNIVHRHVHLMAAQGRGDHFTYFERRHEKVPPSLASQLKKKL